MSPSPRWPSEPDDDVQRALHSAEHHGNDFSASTPLQASVVAIPQHPAARFCWMGLNKCALQAIRYPWQAAGLTLLTVGCCWMCLYFGATVFAALLLTALYSDD